MTIQAIIFDFGGVLLRTHDYSFRTVWDKKLGVSSGTFENYIFNGPVGRLAQIGQASWSDIWADAAQKFRLSAPEISQAEKTFFSGDILDQDLVNNIRQLKATYTIGLLSNTWYSNGQTLLLQYGIADAFHFTVTSAEVGVMKPNHQIYELALNKAHITPSKAIFVDDMEKNVLAARAVGMQAVYFVDREAALKRLNELLNN